MIPNLRIKSSVRSTPIPPGCRAYTFVNYFESISMTVISDSWTKADRYFRDFMDDQGIDVSDPKCGWNTNPFVDDFHVVLIGDTLPRR